MELTVIIVNYNVKFFLEQCLHSVKNASEKNNVEVIVVDNNSADGSGSMVRGKFPQVLLIENKNNLGFSSANNQALRIAKGKYCLLLNPDTIVEENTFIKCINFMDEHPEAGALGVKMIDGKGNFLPESKRALPTPSVAFYKVFGFSRLFPKSKIFGRYHLGFLDNNSTHEVDILCGAFMFIRKKALDETGLLDENFFMYGEDIDISYRIIKEGYKNYYFPETTIIHYKGESTKKGSMNYVIVFYKAMIIFAKKHFTKKNATLLSILINLAIYFRAALSIIKRFVHKVYQPGIDAILIYVGFLIITQFWEEFRFGMKEYFPDIYYIYVVPAYILIWIFSIYYSGGYEKPLRIWNLIRGFLTGALIILVIYALLPESLRYSRVTILLGTLWGISLLLMHRLLFSILKFKDYELAFGRKKRVIIAGGKKEYSRVAQIVGETDHDTDIIGFVSYNHINDGAFIGTLEQLREAVVINKADEIIFCAGDIPSIEIIGHMSALSNLPLEFKIAPPESSAIIGSNSVKSAGELYLVTFNSIGNAVNRRTKRLFDIISSVIIISGFPVFIFIIPSYTKKLWSAMKVLLGMYTWIGYNPNYDLTPYPHLKKSIFPVSYRIDDLRGDGHTTLLNTDYARDYKINKDLKILWKNLFNRSKHRIIHSPPL